MSKQNGYIPLYIKMYERQGRSMEQLVSDVQALSITHQVSEDVELEHVTKSDSNDDVFALVYRVDVKPSRKRHSIAVGLFLDDVFSQLTEKHPTYTEPVS